MRPELPRPFARRTRPLRLVCQLAVLLLAAAESHAYRVYLTSPAEGLALAPGEKFIVEVHIDTEGDTGLVGLSIAVLHPPHVDYHQSESSYTDPILYAARSGGVPTVTGLTPIGPNAPAAPTVS